MGGRIYDPLLGRFLQADPFIQSPSASASLNRHSYVWNNPLNATDPSGFFLSKLWKEVRPFVGAIVGVVLAVYAPWAAEAWAPIVIGMISGAAGAAANGTSIFKGAMFGAFSGVAYGAGGVWGSAIWGGTESYMNGGAFGRGFVAAGIGAMGGAGGGGPSVKGFVTSAVLGGVATEVTGGKFKNGAASAAFMYAVSAGVNRAANSPENGKHSELGGSSESSSAEMSVEARHLTEQGAKAGMSLEISQAELHLAEATQMVDAYFIQNPDAMPEGLLGGLTFEYNHEIHPTAGAVQKMFHNPSANLTMANGAVQMYAGSVNTVKDAVLTILHEYGHHSTAALNARQNRVYQTRRAERAADNYARRVGNEIF